MDSFNLMKNEEQNIEEQKKAEEEKKRLSLEDQQKVLDSLEKQTTTQKDIDANLKKNNKFLEDDWNKQTYHEHKQIFMDGYYQRWEANDQTNFKNKLADIEKVPITDQLKGEFNKQEQPGERFWYKSRKNEKKKIREYENTAKPKYKDYLHFSKNTVREMAALDKYATYHSEYFGSRNNQYTAYINYIDKDKQVVKVQDWKKIYDRQMQAHGKLMGALTGTWKGLYQRGLDLVNNLKPDTEVTRKEEMDKGIRPFFSMTKKVLFWKKQVGLLGTETKEERDDGSEYNKRIMKQYQDNKNGGRTKVMDELARKLIQFKLKPEMFTNKYLASNMLKMQRYTDMLNSFVFLTQCNPNYLDMNSSDHTSPDLAAAIWSRIILLAPIMKSFMEKHAQFNGYRKGKNIDNASRVRDGLSEDEEQTAFKTNEEYDEFVKDTWKAVRKAYNSTIDYMDDAADVKISHFLQDAKNKAAEKRQEKNGDKNDFELKYDKDGTRTKQLQDIKDGILNNPLVYDLFGGEIDQLFKKINMQMRRLDEITVRKEALEFLNTKDTIADKSVGLADYDTIWKDYINKELKRMESERDIINDQLTNYTEAIKFFTNLNLNEKTLSLDAKPSIKNVLKYEGLDHVFNLQKAFEYNDLFYKTLDYYDFDKFDEIKNEKGEVTTTIKDMWAKYNYTLLKRGIGRSRYVNKLVDGKMAVDIKDPAMLNNIERRKTAIENYEKYEKKYGSIPADYKTLLEIKPSEIGEKIGIKGELDITKEETFKTYFWMKNMVELYGKLEYENKAPEEYKNFSYNQKLDIRIKGRLLKDYFHKWNGVIQYTMSEAYEYVYDTASIQGNNKVIDGIDKEYRLTTLTEMQSKIVNKMDEFISEHPEAETDENKYPEYKKLVEMKKYLDGMREANDYDANILKLVDENAYESYKVELIKDDKVRKLKDIYNEDFDILVKNKLAVDTEEDRKAYLDRIDTALELQEKCEYFVKHKKECLAKIGINIPNDASLNKNYIELQFSLKKQEKIDKAKKDGKYNSDKDYELTKKDKSKYLLAYRDKFRTICKKVKEEYCTENKLDDQKIVTHIGDILTDLDFAIDFVAFNHQLYKTQSDLIDSTYSSEDLEKMAEQEVLITDFAEYINMLLADYGISRVDDYNFRNRHAIKRDIVKMDKEFSSEVAQLEKEEKIFTANEKEYFRQRDNNLERLNKVQKLREQDLSTKKLLPDQEMEKLYRNGDDSVEMKIICNAPAYRFKSQYDEEYKALQDEREKLDRSLSEQNEQMQLFKYLKYGALDENVKKKETDETGKKSDWILLRKESRKLLIEKSLEKQEKTQPRNCVEELFDYIYKKAGNVEILDHDKIIDILTKATQTYFFTLSARAKKEAEIRLSIYKKDKSVMNDYFIWKSDRDNEEAIINRCKVFGQDKFVAKNIKTIKNIMNVIAESNAAVNDIQTPMFRDALKEDLTMKGIDEKQFMFLLRRHDVGFSGKAVNRASAHKADKNKFDVSDYLYVATKDDFLLRTAESVLELGDSIKLEDINEEYIIRNFDKCYFNANKLLAFQQLYYGEKENFDRLHDKTGNRGLINKVRKFFDKGHGESYALYFNAVISVAKKYGITENGGLSFGLTLEEIETLRDETKTSEHKKLQNKAGENLEIASENVTENLNAIKTAYDETDLAIKIGNAAWDTLVSVDPEEVIKKDGKKKLLRDTYGLDLSNDKQTRNLEKFYNTYSDAYNGANKLYYRFQEREKDQSKVTYTNSNSFQPKMMFLMAPNKSLSMASNKIAEIPMVSSFKDLFNEDTDNVAANLSVIDEKKCEDVVNIVKQLRLDMGKIGKLTEKGNAIFDEAFFDEELKRNPDFYVSMVNAMNFCVIFESGVDLLKIEAYKKQVDEAYTDKNLNKDMLELWEKNQTLEKEYLKSKETVQRYEDQERKLRDEQEAVKMQIKRLKLTQENIKDNNLKIEDLNYRKEELDKQIADITGRKDAAIKAKDATLEIYYHTHRDLYQNGKQHADKFRPDLLTATKASTLSEVQKLFSDNKTRFMVSTYFDLFSAYLLKKGVKIDGSMVNVKIYDEILDESIRSKLGQENMNRQDALDMGKILSSDMKGITEEYFKAKQEYIKNGSYLKEYNSLEKVQNKITKEQKELPKLIQTTLDDILKKKSNKKFKNMHNVEFVLTKLSEDERFMLRKYGSSDLTLKGEKRKDEDVNTLKTLRRITVLMEVFDRIKNIDDASGFDRLLPWLSLEEINIVSEYTEEFRNFSGEYSEAHHRIDALRTYMLAKGMKDKYKAMNELLGRNQKPLKNSEVQ